MASQRRRRPHSILLALVALLLCAFFAIDTQAEQTKPAADADTAASDRQPTTATAPDAAIPARDTQLVGAAEAAAALKRKEDEARDVRYIVGLLASAPAVPAPVGSGSAAGSRTLVMTAQSGQKFRCTIPHPEADSTINTPDTYRPPVNDETETTNVAAADGTERAAPAATPAAAPAAAAAATAAPAVPPAAKAPAPSHPTIRTLPDSKVVPSLVRSALGNGCFTKLVDYWTYEVCPFRRVRQYHRQPDNQAISVEFSLGSYTAAGDHVAAAASTAGTANAAGAKPVQYTQLFEGGTNNRQSSVRFLCNSDAHAAAAAASSNPHLLMEVREPKAFHYEFVIRTTLLCRDAQGRLGTSEDDKLEQPAPAAASAAAAAAPAKSGVGQGVRPGADREPANAAPQQPTPPGFETGRLRTGAFRRKPAGASASGSGPSASSALPNVMDLLEPLGSECLYLNTGWWTYSFCYLKQITQFHREQIQIPIQAASVKAATGAGGAAGGAGGAATGSTAATPAQPAEPIPVKLGARSAAEAAANIAEAAAANQAVAASLAAATGATHITKLVTTAEFTLGLLPASTSLDAIEADTVVVRGDSWESTYVSQHYHSGTLCDLNGRPRTTETRIYCDMSLTSSSEQQVASIKSVVEAATCQYIVIVHSPLMCAHPHFKPIVPKTVEITCEPITNDGKPTTLTPHTPSFANVASLLFQP